MKKEWKSNNYNNVRQIVEAHTHMSAEEFLYPQKDPYLHGLKEAVQFVKLKLRHKVPVHIVGDYDVDGEMSTAILELALETFGGYPVHVRLPRRFSEGYGLSMKIIDEISDGLIITVDNGIAALEQVKAAKAKGLSVVVIDHHLPVRNPDTEEIILPEADYVIDPKAIEGSMFSEYCGAGLAYRFAKALLTEEHPIMNNLLVFASIATVTDMVPLIGDNRTIVKEGLKHINQRDVTFGLQILLDRLKLNHVTEEDYGFLIGPVMNASGRMLDDGPIDVVNMVTSLADPANPEFIRKTMYLQDLADELVERNEKRKEAVEKDLIEAENIIRKKTLMNNNPLIVYSPNFWEGTIGILAGKLAEKYQVPCLVFTKSSAKGIAKGSGRIVAQNSLAANLKKLDDIYKRGEYDPNLPSEAHSSTQQQTTPADPNVPQQAATTNSQPTQSNPVLPDMPELHTMELKITSNFQAMENSYVVKCEIDGRVYLLYCNNPVPKELIEAQKSGATITARLYSKDKTMWYYDLAS